LTRHADKNGELIQEGSRAISTENLKGKKIRSEETVKEPLSLTQHLVVTIEVSHYDWRFSRMHFRDPGNLELSY